MTKQKLSTAETLGWSFGSLGWSPTDITAYLYFPNEAPIVMNDLIQFSLSTHRERFPVSKLGSVQPVGYTHGPLTVAGSMTLQEFNEIPLLKMRTELQTKLDYRSLPRMDELPPLNMLLVLGNEEGDRAEMSVTDMHFLDEGYSTGTDQGITYLTYSWVGRDYRVMGSNDTEIVEPEAAPTPASTTSPPQSTVAFSAEDLTVLA